jgi:hypothetical protein
MTKYRRITKRDARRRFAANEPILLIGCKFYPSTPFNQAVCVYGAEYLERAKQYRNDSFSGLWKGSVENTAWDLMYNNWAYYNTSYETGYYAHYYVEEEERLPTPDELQEASVWAAVDAAPQTAPVELGKFADWLADRADPREAAVRWAAENGKVPAYKGDKEALFHGWNWWGTFSTEYPPSSHVSSTLFSPMWAENQARYDTPAEAYKDLIRVYLITRPQPQ